MARAENLAGSVACCMSHIQPQPPRLRKYRRPSPYSDERPGWTGPSAAVGTTGGAAFFNCSSSA